MTISEKDINWFNIPGMKTMIQKDTKKLMDIVIDDNPSEEEKQWALFYLNFMIHKLNACE